MPDARHSLLSQWSRKMGSQQSGGSEDMATILGNGTEASPSLARCAAPRLRGGGGSSVFTAAYGLIVDQDAPASGSREAPDVVGHVEAAREGHVLLPARGEAAGGEGVPASSGPPSPTHDEGLEPRRACLKDAAVL